MDERLDEASVAFEVNIAHIPSELVVELGSVELVLPLTVPVADPLQPYTTPIAAVLQRALALLRTVGWCAEHWDDQGAVCLVRAIRTEAGGGTLGGQACAFLLDVIRAEFGPWETVPSWNDAQVGPAVPLRILGQAADTAAARGI
jgi:hypothetical protein